MLRIKKRKRLCKKKKLNKKEILPSKMYACEIRCAHHGLHMCEREFGNTLVSMKVCGKSGQKHNFMQNLPQCHKIHPQYKLVPVITCILATINSHSFSLSLSLSFLFSP